MNKLIEQTVPDILKICYGNDFSINVTVTEKNAETGTWEVYDLSAASDVELFLVSQNGKRIKTTYVVNSDGSITADIPAAYLSKTTYSIEITFTYNGRNRRTYSPCLIQIVNTTEESSNSIANYNTTDAYHFNIKIEGDIAWLNIGSLPSEYVKEDELSYILTSYVTTTSLDNTLTSYAKNSEVENQINALWQDCNNTFIDNDELGTALSSYVTQSSLSEQSYVTDTSLDSTLDSYASKDYVDTAISNIPSPDMSPYVTHYYLDNASYITGSALTSYVNGGVYNSTDHTIDLKHDSTVVASIDASAFLIDGMIENVYISNGYLVIEFNTDAGKQDIEIPLTSIFDPSNYYTKSDIDTTLSAYVTTQALSQMAYVTQQSLSNNSYVSTSDVETILASASYVTQASLSNNAYVNQTSLDTTLASYVTQQSLSNNSYVTHDYLDSAAYITINDIPQQTGEVTYAFLDSCGYVTQQSLSNNTYVTQQSLSANTYATEAYVTTAISNIPAGGGEVTYAFLDAQSYVHSYDATYIYVLTQSEYDTLAYNNQLDPYTLYYISDSTPNYITRLDLQNYVSMTNLQQMAYVNLSDVPTQLSQLNNNVGYITQADLSGNSYVSSSTVNTIWTGSQADYDLLTPDANTLYVIV